MYLQIGANGKSYKRWEQSHLYYIDIQFDNELKYILGAGGQFAQASNTINANDILTNMALYYATGNAAQQNVPVQYFLFVTLVSSISSKDRVQFGIAISGATIYSRSYNGSNWTAWQQLAKVS